MGSTPCLDAVGLTVKAKSKMQDFTWTKVSKVTPDHYRGSFRRFILTAMSFNNLSKSLLVYSDSLAVLPLHLPSFLTVVLPCHGPSYRVLAPTPPHINLIWLFVLFVHSNIAITVSYFFYFLDVKLFLIPTSI